ncbi:MAG: carbamoyltransferase HypF [bacterium]
MIIESGKNQTRLRLRIRGVVQGVGFRPFIYGLAGHHRLRGFVLNDAEGVLLEVEGPQEQVRAFLEELPRQAPLQSVISQMEPDWLSPAGYGTFEIRESVRGASHSTLVSYDIAVCADCLSEMRDPTDRRYGYPFINCTNCGPRFTIIKDIPYDRNKTTMSLFPMCPDCREEYEDPRSRRFHAQPNACFACGPSLTLMDNRGNLVAGSGLMSGPAGGKDVSEKKELNREAIARTALLLGEGKIVAIKGLGGFHLACDAENQEAVFALRRRKVREGKPFALMAPDIRWIKNICRVSSLEENLLESARRPIVLLRKKTPSTVAPEAAPSQKFLGVMLPYTPLHYLLMESAGKILIMTSGNLSDEPIAWENAEALERLSAIADYFLLHNRDIHIRCDDSVTRIFSGAELPLRRSRGYVPFPVEFPGGFKKPLLACGGELKNTFCLGRAGFAFVGHHIGDLENAETLLSFEEGVAHFQRLFSIRPEVVAHDLHPEYLSTKYALAVGSGKKIGVQHHHAHIASVMAEHGLDGLRDKVLGVALDGAGLGEDGTLWGGEFLLADFMGYERVAHFQSFRLLGGEKAVREPWRMALSCLYAVYGEDLWNLKIPFLARLKDRALPHWPLLRKMLDEGLGSPWACGTGRLFDAVSALLGICEEARYEGEGAVGLEMACGKPHGRLYPLEFEGSGPYLIRVEELIGAVVKDIATGRPVSEISSNFHRALAAGSARMLVLLRKESGIRRVVLGGGVFQNTTLLSLLLRRLEKEDFEVLLPRLLPPNDGGLSLGQAAVANARCS